MITSMYLFLYGMLRSLPLYIIYNLGLEVQSVVLPSNYIHKTIGSKDKDKDHR